MMHHLLCRPVAFLLAVASPIAMLCAESRIAVAESTVVVSPNGPLPRVVAAAGVVHQSAAEDLCDYLGRVTGRTIAKGGELAQGAVTIHVGPDAFALEHAPEMKGLFADGYVLKTLVVDKRQHIILAGMRGSASRWAVEAFLKRYCGVRWLFPNDAKYGEIVPSRPTISVEAGLAEKHEPSYLGRANCQMYFFDKTHSYLRLGPSDADFGSHALQHAFDSQDFVAHPDWFALFSAPDSDLSRFHPELVGIKDRKRRWHWDYGNGWQICTSNPETVQHAVEYARAWLDKNPEAAAVAMGHNDGEGWCECERCQAFIKSASPPYTQSEQYWNWVNQVARELAKTHPEKLVATIAYGTPATPPRFELEKNIAVTVTFSLESHLELAKKWKKKCRSVNLYSYPYGTNVFAGFRHYPHAMRDFLKWGHDELGAISHVAEVYGDWSFDGPKYHYMQALQWNVNADPDVLMQEYCRDWFGAASKPMLEFWNGIEKVYERSSPTRWLVFYDWVGWSDNHDEFDHYTLADVEGLDRSIAAAEKQAGTDADRFRVARVADGWKYYRCLLLGKLRFYDRRNEVITEASKTPARAVELARELATLQAQRTEFMRRLRSYPHINPSLTTDYYWSGLSNVELFSRMRTLVDDLCSVATRQHLEVANGREEALKYWQQIEPHDVLFNSARTQLAILEKQEPSILANGDFESGAIAGWNSTGYVQIVKPESRHGHYALESIGASSFSISQTVRVHPRERYKLAALLQSAHPTAATFSGSLRVDWQASGKPVYAEPTYCKLPKVISKTDWQNVHTTLDVPPGADTAVITLTCAGAPLRIDEFHFHRILSGPKMTPGRLADDFTQETAFADQWIEATAGGSGRLPNVADGRLVFEKEPMATLISMNTFNDVLDGTAEKRYRLQIHVVRGTDNTLPGSFDCGIGSGTVPITTAGSGCYFTHMFAEPGKGPQPLRTYWNQDSKGVTNGSFEVKPGVGDGPEIWYTLLFDPKQVTVFAGNRGYDESPAALLGTFAHQMTKISSQGPVFLKICGRNVALDEISLSRPTK